MSDLSYNLLKTEHVIGVKVLGKEKENLGKVEELVIDKESGVVVYAVLSFGGIFGLGEKLFALPWEILTYEADEKAFRVNIEKETLKEAPGFDKDHWPDMLDPDWKTSINRFYEL